MKTIKSGKFIMLCISCIILNSYSPLQGYKNAVVLSDTDRQRKEVERYAKKLGIELKPIEEGTK